MAFFFLSQWALRGPTPARRVRAGRRALFGAENHHVTAERACTAEEERRAQKPKVAGWRTSFYNKLKPVFRGTAGFCCEEGVIVVGRRGAGPLLRYLNTRGIHHHFYRPETTDGESNDFRKTQINSKVKTKRMDDRRPWPTPPKGRSLRVLLDVNSCGESAAKGPALNK